MREHQPLVAVDRPADLAQLAVGLEGRRREHVAQQVVGGDLQRRVVAPGVRIADLRVERVELLGTRAAWSPRPSSPASVDAAPVGLEEVADELDHQGLRLGREVPLDVPLADRLAERALDEGDPALPAGAQLRGAVERATVEVEVRLDEVAGQVARGAAEHPDHQQLLERLERRLRQDLLQVREVRRLPHDDLGEQRSPSPVAPADRLGVRRPVERRQQRAQLRVRGQVVGPLHVAGLMTLPVTLCDPGLHVHHPRASLLRVGAPGELEEPLQVGDVLLRGSRRTCRRGSRTRRAARDRPA